MPAIRALSHAEFTARLNTYGCHFIRKLDDGSELWETSWKEPFTIRADTDGSYDEWEYLRLEVVKALKPR